MNVRNEKYRLVMFEPLISRMLVLGALDTINLVDSNGMTALGHALAGVRGTDDNLPGGRPTGWPRGNHCLFAEFWVNPEY